MNSAVLSKYDLSNLQRILKLLAHCTVTAELNTSLSECRSLLGADYCIAVHSQNSNIPRFSEVSILNNSYPKEWLQLYQSHGFQFVDPIVQRLLKSWQQQVWDNDFKASNQEKEFSGMARSFGLKHGLTYGMPSKVRSGHTLVSFADSQNSFGPREFTLMELLIGPLHTSIEQVMTRRDAKPLKDITSRERVILGWLSEGKSSWEISRMLQISERTVKFHLGNLYRKLEVTNRAQAVSAAVQAGLLCLS
jgi:LuxR family transcriptional regulator, quorum-sensing system regulator CviR